MTPKNFGANEGQNEKGNQIMNKLHINKKPLLLGLSSKRKITVGIMAATLTLLAGPAFAFSDVFFKSGTLSTTMTLAQCMVSTLDVSLLSS